ncbi:MAG: hypothetical protein GC202_04750 [Alphaproteobacteria bacterium]|nr:hypothetical protein [Alphaproteobacteria bacterium]
MSETLVNDRIYIGSNSVAQWFVTLGESEGRPCLIAHQVFIDAPKQMNAVARQLASGRLFFSLKQLETLMLIRHGVEISLAESDRQRIERHIWGAPADRPATPPVPPGSSTGSASSAA